MKKICVFCGSSHGKNPLYEDAAHQLGRVLVENNLELVFGGGNVGLMGEISRTVLSLGGKSTGVIPDALYRKVDMGDLTELHVVADMHERKGKMYELSDAFIAIPGGIGTLEELIEIFTWGQLGYHSKPVGLLNTCGFYDFLLEFLSHMTKEEFLKSVHFNNLVVGNDPVQLVTAITSFKPTAAEKWVRKHRS